MDNTNLMTLLVLLALMILAYFIGRFISKLLGGGAMVTNEENESLQAQISNKEAALAACKQKNDGYLLKHNDVPSVAKVSITNNIAPVVAAVAETIVHKKDDLKVIEGIGPKIEELLHNAGILSFAQLASSSVETIKGILEAAGPRYQIHNPSTWPQQSELCAAGKWTALKILQDELNAGKAM